MFSGVFVKKRMGSHKPDGTGRMVQLVKFFTMMTVAQASRTKHALAQLAGKPTAQAIDAETIHHLGRITN